ncbi:MAG: chromosome segregation protein SMC [Peptoniphilaceae bacterium]
MYLKSLYIQGFKSFAKKTKIEFNNKVTGIVGPNGSGKSNITDAIMWVLGENSAKSLRGSKMEDVIFSGTDNKRPLSLAEVTIVFDNCDKSLPIKYKEVSVTRRIYRSGESEFLINNTKCRLKDIKELFMDTGIGKDGYSLIGQGKIESILSNKPEQRRSVFEEAAGISKYKMKKLESENKLKKTEENILRLNDIISEIEDREKVLKKESENAKKYKSLFNELKSLDITWSKMQISNEEKSIENLEKKLELVNEEFNYKNKQLDIKNKEIEDFERELNQLDILIEEKQLNKYEINNILEKSNSRREILKEKINNSKNGLNEKRKSIKFLKEKINERNIENKELNISLTNKLGNKNSLKKSLESHRVELKGKVLELKNFEENLAYTNQEIFNLHKEKSDLESKLELNKSLSKDKLNRVGNLDKNLKVLDQNNEDIISSLNEIKKKLDNFKILENQKELISKDLNKEIDYKKNELSKIKSNLTLSKETYEREKARFIALKSISDNYEGYNKSVRSFMNICKKRGLFKKDLIGPIAENIKVDKKYEKAISIALGASSQNIIIEDSNSAKSMIDFLIREKLGRVTFLPLNSMKYIKPNLNLGNFKGIIGFADQLVQYDTKFNNVIKFLLGRIIIADDFKNANEFSKSINRSYRVVSLEGDSLNIGGSITGGSIAKYSSEIISRKNELENLETKIINLKNEYEFNNNQFIKLEEELNSYETKLKNTQKELMNLKNKIINLENNLESLLKSKDSNLKYLNSYKDEKSKILDSIKIDNKNIEILEKKLTSINENIIFKSNNDNKTKEDLHALREELEELRKNENAKDVILIKLDSEIKSLNKEIDNNNNFNNIDKEKIKEIKLEIDNLEKELVDLNKSIESTFVDSEEEKNKILDLDNEIKFLKKNRENKNKDSKNLRTAIEELRKNLINTERKSIKLTSDIEKNKINIRNIYDKIIEKYEVDINRVKVEQFNLNVETLNDEIKKLNAKIKNLGEVNLLSIVEYEEISKRLSFNIEQKKDLLDSRDEIISILKELEIEMRTKFNETLKETAKYFNEIFRILFNGGQAKIEVNDEDLLNSGIDIKAQPPGKRFQSLSLLSGGERSLTAVSLLFALLKVRPAPFCILDEIDAALDDANIKRYADYLMTLNDIQFIVITHRKLTMEIANVLYGVTMEEKGVSKIISVELKTGGNNV